MSVGTFIYTPDARFQVKVNQSIGEYNLKIRKLNLNDTGKYACESRNQSHTYG